MKTIKPIVWMYWEGPCPSYIELCYQTILQACQHDFMVYRLCPSTVHHYLPLSICSLLFSSSIFHSIPQKTDLLRLSLLYYHGGVWIDSDMICFASLKPYWDHLSTYDYVGFGCYYDTCDRIPNGSGYPANWMMMSKAKGQLVSMALTEAIRIVQKHPERLSTSYHCLGKDLLRDCILMIRTQRPSWGYFHVLSTCVERTGKKNQKMTNRLLLTRNLSLREIDPDCFSKRVVLPLYHTSPGFPDWFKKWSVDDLLSGDLLICDVFRTAFTCISSSSSSSSSFRIIDSNLSNGKGKKSM